MEAYEIKNYEKSVPEMVSKVPIEVHKENMKHSIAIIRKHLGFFKRLRLGSTMRKTRKRFFFASFFDVKEKGLKDERILMSTVAKAQQYSAVKTLAGQEKAQAIAREIVDTINKRLLSLVLPSAADFQQLEKPFAGFKEWITAFWKRNRQLGLYDFKVTENSDHALQIDCTYCAVDTINRIVQEKDYTPCTCHADDVLFSSWDNDLGIEYKRTGALATDHPCCQFRFELKGKSQ